MTKKVAPLTRNDKEIDVELIFRLLKKNNVPGISKSAIEKGIPWQEKQAVFIQASLPTKKSRLYVRRFSDPLLE